VRGGEGTARVAGLADKLLNAQLVASATPLQAFYLRSIPRFSRGPSWLHVPAGHRLVGAPPDVPAPCTLRAVLFWSLKTEGVLDQGSLHGSCPTSKGVKFAATKW